jgi:HEAT repeat protein
VTKSIEERIVALRTHTDSLVRRQAAESLVNDPSPDVIRTLIVALQDSDESVRKAACNSLTAIDSREVVPVIAQYVICNDHEQQDLCTEVLLTFGNQAIHALEPYLHDSDLEIRKVAIGILGQSKHKDAATALIPLLYDLDPSIVSASIEGLGCIADERAVSHLIQVYEQDEYARPAIAEALGRIGGPVSSAFLCTSFQSAISSDSSDPLTLFGIIEALGRIGDAEAFAMLTRLLPEVKGRLRQMMLAAMVWIADKSCLVLDIPDATVQDFIGLVQDGDVRVRLNAIRALSGVIDPSVTRAFLEALGSSDYCDVVLCGLLESRDDCFPLLLEKLNEIDCTNKKELLVLARTLITGTTENGNICIRKDLFERAFDAIWRQWDASNEKIKALIIETLLAIDEERALATLHAMMDDPDPWLRTRIIELVGTLDDARLVGFVSEYLRDEDEMVRTTAEWVSESKCWSEKKHRDES